MRDKLLCVFYHRYTDKYLSIKWGHGYSLTPGWLRCCLSFSLLCSAIACIHGSRSSSGRFDRAPPPMDLVSVESHLMNYYTLLFVCFNYGGITNDDLIVCLFVSSFSNCLMWFILKSLYIYAFTRANVFIIWHHNHSQYLSTHVNFKSAL